MKLVVINGFPMSGKDTFVQFCQLHCKDICLNISTVDFVKLVAEECGWDGTKTSANRKFLSDFKKLITEWNDVPYKKVKEVASHYDSWEHSDRMVMFIHCREPEEIKKFVERDGAITLFIRRNNKLEKYTNESDTNVEKFDYDYYIDNNGSLYDLEKEAINFLQKINIETI